MHRWKRGAVTDPELKVAKGTMAAKGHGGQEESAGWREGAQERFQEGPAFDLTCA